MPSPLRHVAAKGVAAALLTADKRIVLQHRRRHEFEADACLHYGHVVGRAQLIQHRGRAEGLDNRTAFAAHLKQVVGEQPVDAQLIDELAILIAEAAAVGVPVKNTDTVGLYGAGDGQAGVHIGGNRLGAVHFRKGRIALRMDFDDFGFAAAEDFGQPAGAIAPHAVDNNFETGVANVCDIDQAGQVGEIGGLRLMTPHCAGGEGRVKRHVPYPVRIGDTGFDGRQSIRRHSAAAGVPHFEAVVLGRIVAGGDVYGADSVVIDGSEADHRRRCGPVDQQNLQAVGGQHLRHRGGEVFTLKALVVADNDRLGGKTFV